VWYRKASHSYIYKFLGVDDPISHNSQSISGVDNGHDIPCGRGLGINTTRIISQHKLGENFINYTELTTNIGLALNFAKKHFHQTRKTEIIICIGKSSKRVISDHVLKLNYSLHSYAD
jgi:hypothetical protein